MRIASEPVPAIAATLAVAYLTVVAPLWVRFRTRPFALAFAYWASVTVSVGAYAFAGEELMGRLTGGFFGIVPGILLGHLFGELGGYRYRHRFDLWIYGVALVLTLGLSTRPRASTWVEIIPAFVQGAAMVRAAVVALLHGRSLGFLGRSAAVLSLAFGAHSMNRPFLLSREWDPEIGWLIATGLACTQLPMLLGALVEKEARRVIDLEYEVRTQRALASTGRLVAVGELAASIVHELGTPLATLQVQLELLRRDTANGTRPTGRMTSYLRDFETSTDHLRAILRNVGRTVREGEADPEELLPADRLVELAVQMVEGRYRTAAVPLRIVSEAAGTVVCGRAVQLVQVLANLLLNACDAVEGCDDRRRWVELRTSCTDRELVVRVIDGGSGVPESLRTEVFRALITTKPPGRGMGLGLSFARRVAQEHGGNVELESASAPTTFRLRLPLAESAAPGLETASYGKAS